jgi:hypothetical protein
MASTINASTASGGGVITSADASGILQLQTAGVTGLTIDASQNVTFANSLTSPTLVTPVINGMGSSILTSATAQASTSGTSIDFTGIPSWVKRITVMLSGVSTSGTSGMRFQFKVGGTAVTSNYTASMFAITTAIPASVGTAVTNGFPLSIAGTGSAQSGQIVFSQLSTDIWVGNGSFYDSNPTERIAVIAGRAFSVGTVDGIRVTTTGGTDTFDAGSINIMYE